MIEKRPKNVQNVAGVGAGFKKLENESIPFPRNLVCYRKALNYGRSGANLLRLSVTLSCVVLAVDVNRLRHC